MSSQRAVLVLDPQRRAQQLSFIAERDPNYLEFGERVWAMVTEEQAEVFSRQGIVVQFQSEADVVEVPAGAFRPAQDVPQPPAALTATEPTRSNRAYYIVLFVASLDEFVDGVTELGAELIDDLPGPAMIFKLTSEQTTQVRALSYVVWVGLYHPAYALHYDLAGSSEPLDAIAIGRIAVDPARVVEIPEGNLIALPFSDVTTEDLRPALETAGATIASDLGYALAIRATAERVPQLLRVPGLHALERNVPSHPTNQRGGIIIGVNQVRNFGRIDFLTNLDGTGEIVHVVDTGLDNGNGFPLHPDLAGRVILPINNANGVAITADFQIHGTHVAGSVAGNGAAALAAGTPTIPTGTAPGAQIFFTAVNSALPAAPGNQAPLSYLHYLASYNRARTAGARIHTNSFGNDFNNGYSNTGTGQLDRFCFLNPEHVVLFSSDNNEGDYNNNGRLDMNRLGDDATAKNIITVGACENDTNLDGTALTYPLFFGNRHANAGLNPLNQAAPVPGNFPFSDNPNQTALFSERGRVVHSNAALRRVKPDLVAPGTNIVSLGRIVLPPPGPAGGPGRPLPPAVSAPPASYAVTSGTSMATPLVAGCCALVRQFYRSLFGQLRRPVQMEAISSFIDNPSIASHRNGVVICWVRPGPNNDIVAARFTPEMVRQGAIVVLQTNVGADPAPVLAQSGDNTFLLHRASDNSLRLSKYDGNLAPVAAFGGTAPAPAGVVILSPNSRSEDDRHPALCVRGNEVAVAWMQTGTDNLLFQRFRIDNGQKIDANPLTLGTATNTSPNQYLIHNGTRYAAVWAQRSGANHQVMMRFVENNGTLAGTTPLTLVTQAQPIRAPHPAWNSRVNRFRLVWISDDVHAGGDIMSQRFNANGSADPLQAAGRVVTVGATNTARQPLIQLHPTTGYTLLWEDNTQASQGHGPPAPARNSFDVYLGFLSEDGIPDLRVPGNRQQLSDTPNDTVGFAAFTDGGGIFAAWNSNDEINSDVNSVYAVKLTLQGAFAAQEDHHTPLLNSGRYVSNRLAEHDAVDQQAMALIWGGGPYFHLQLTSAGPAIHCFLVRTTADGLPDLAFGGTGSRRLDLNFGFEGLAVMWAGTRLMVATAHPIQFNVFLFDADGNPEATFGVNGVFAINENPAIVVNPQLGFNGTGNSFRMFVAWANTGGPKPMLRGMVLNRQGTVVMAARDLGACDGTGRHGWFHFIPSESRGIAVWHEQVGGNMVIRLNRFNFSNPAATMRQHNPALTLAAPPAGPTALPGNSQNPVLAPRPVLFEPPFPTPNFIATQTRQREYGLAFQNQPPGANWQIMFSRLQRNGTLGAVVNRVVVANATDHCTDPQLLWHTNGYGLAWLQQATGGGPHRLMFTVIDQAGGNSAPASHQVSSATADVQQFQLVWNGRSFRVGWTELEGGVIRQMQSALALPRMAAPAGFNQPYQHPSAALVRATLINGATNYNNTRLPNVPLPTAGHNPNDGYGWGRVNMRQSLAPAPPVTFYVRDDGAVAEGRTVRYVFALPPDTRLLRVTLVWTDPPGNTLVNNLNLRLTTPGGARVYVGNRWSAATPQFSDPVPAVPPVNLFETVHPVEQIVIPGTPTLPVGDYIVEVVAGSFNTAVFLQHPGQPFSLVFVGSGVEWPLVPPATIGGGLPFF